jgi:pyridoxal 5'-phosphate synthase pdxT subunit
VHRNHFGRQIESFESDLDLPFLAQSATAIDGESTAAPFPGVFIRAPVVEQVLEEAGAAVPGTGTGTGTRVEVLAKLAGRVDKMKKGVSQAQLKDDSGDIIAVRQGNVLGMSFHPELTPDARIHTWWLQQLIS